MWIFEWEWKIFLRRYANGIWPKNAFEMGDNVATNPEAGPI